MLCIPYEEMKEGAGERGYSVWPPVLYTYCNVAEIFLNDYDVVDVFDNDRLAIMSRIDYIERNEPRRSFLNIF